MVVAGVFLLGCFRRERPWAEVALGELGRLRTPADLRERHSDPDITQDYSAFTFQRVHDTHLNEQTSYAEDLQITVFAEDLELERMERGTHAFGYASILSKPKDDVWNSLRCRTSSQGARHRRELRLGTPVPRVGF